MTADPTIRYATWTEPGGLHPENQDRLAADPDRVAFVVADGMGGLADGAATAQLVVDRLTAESTVVGADPAATLAAVGERLNETVRRTARRGPGTTGASVALLVVRAGTAFVVHAGDSRIYLVRAGQALLLTVDHARDGQLTRFVGMLGRFRPEVAAHPLRAGDRLLLCTDGLTRGLDDERLSRLLSRAVDPERACRELAAAARAGGSADDLSVIVLDYGRCPG